MLLRKKQINSSNTVIETRDYISGTEYVDAEIESVYHSEGRAHFVSNSWRYEYILKDHLGNSRIVYYENNDVLEVLTEHHYYLHGMKMNGPWASVPSDAISYQFNSIDYVDDFGLNVNMATFRTLDPATARWWSVDPAAEVLPDMTPYCAMNGSPMMYSDPEGDIAHLLIGAGIGGLLNLGINALQGNVNGSNWAGYFGIGAVSGILGAGVGGGFNSLLGGGSFGAGFIGSSSASSAVTSFASGAVIGGSSGFVGGFSTGFGNSLFEGQSASEAFKRGTIEGGLGALSGAVVGGLTSGVDAAINKRYFWTGEEQRMLADFKLNVPLVEQSGEYDCAFACLEAIEKMNGGTRTQHDFAKLLSNPKNGANTMEAITKGGFTAKAYENGIPIKVGRAMSAGKPTIIALPEGKIRHAVIPTRLQIWQRGTSKTFYKTWVMDPATGKIGRKFGQSLWKNPIFIFQ